MLLANLTPKASMLHTSSVNLCDFAKENVMPVTELLLLTCIVYNQTRQKLFQEILLGKLGAQVYLCLCKVFL